MFPCCCHRHCNIHCTILVLLSVNKNSNSTLPVTIWGDRASDFDADAIYNAGQTQPQIIVFVGTLVKDYTGLGTFCFGLSLLSYLCSPSNSLLIFMQQFTGLTVTGSSPCKWYLNLNIPEVLELRERCLFLACRYLYVPFIEYFLAFYHVIPCSKPQYRYAALMQSSVQLPGLMIQLQALARMLPKKKRLQRSWLSILTKTRCSLPMFLLSTSQPICSVRLIAR